MGSRTGLVEGTTHLVRDFVGTANELVAPLHDRMAAILAPDDYATWLDPTQPRQAIDRLLRPCPAGWLRGWRVSRAVSKAGAAGADLIAPITESRGS